MTKLYVDPFGPPWQFHSLRILLAWRGSIFQFFWMEWLVATGLCALGLLGWYLCYKGLYYEALSPTIRILINVFGFVAGRFQAAVSLMLGFYTSTLYNRWWKVRDVEGVVIGRINDLAVQLSALIRDDDDDNVDNGQDHQANKTHQRRRSPPTTSDRLTSAQVHDLRDDHDLTICRTMSCSSMGSTTRHDDDDYELEETAVRRHDVSSSSGSFRTDEVRMQLVRYLNLAHAIAVGELYEKQPNEFTSLDNLVELGLLADNDEYDCMMSTTRSRYQIPFVWFLDLLHQLKDIDKCGVTDATLIIVCNNVTRIRGSLADLYMYRNTPVPLSYRQLVNVTVRMYMVIIVIAGGLSHLNLDEENIAVDSSIFFILIAFFFEYFLFVGWLKLADALGNPFRVWADELEWENYVRAVTLGSNLCLSNTTTRKACTSLADVGTVARSLDQKRAKISAKWDQLTRTHSEDDIQLGLHEIHDGKRKTGLRKVRRNLTGY